MKNSFLKLFGAVSILMLVVLGVSKTSSIVLADPPPPKTICHATGNGTYNTLHTNVNAINGHFENNGTPKDGHEDDILYDGTVGCPGPEPTATPTMTPTSTPVPTATLTPTPTPIDDCEERKCDPTATPSPTPSTSVTPIPTNPPNNGGPGDGLSDGRSDGRSSCPECTAPPKTDEVLGATTEGQVLGASTDFAATGSAVDSLMNAIGAIGAVATTMGATLIAKKRNA